MSDEADTLTTLALTLRERAQLAASLAVTMGMQQALGEDTREQMDLWMRVYPDGVEL
jgi:hypothetical protein